MDCNKVGIIYNKNNKLWVGVDNLVIKAFTKFMFVITPIFRMVTTCRDIRLLQTPVQVVRGGDKTPQSDVDYGDQWDLIICNI